MSRKTKSTALSTPAPATALPIFAHSDKGKAKNGRPVHSLKIGTNTVPLTQEEHSALNQRLNQHINTHGVKYGFVASLLGSAANYVPSAL